MINLLYLLDEDPDNYWIKYDFLIENGWAEPEPASISYLYVGACSEAFIISSSRSGNEGISYLENKFCSSCSDLLESRIDDEWYSTQTD
jgi:hypothetical protein